MDIQKKLLNLKVAITHDYLVMTGGAEKVLKEILEIFPQAEIYTSIYAEEKFTKDFNNLLGKHKIHTSHINKLPSIEKYWRAFIPTIAKYFEHLDLKEYDLVISNSSSFSKWLNLEKHTKHISYIHTPPRFIWGFKTSNLHKLPSIFNFFKSGMLQKYKQLDFKYANKIDLILTNSINIQSKIQEIYKKDSYVIYPPIEFKPIEMPEVKKDYYIILSRLVAYKNIDMAIKAFNKLDKELVIVGEGEESKSLKKLASNNIKFVGFVDEETKYNYLREAKALIYPGEEDFGIAMVEALHSYTPVIALNRGGAREIVDSGSGILFEDETPESLIQAIKLFEKQQFDLKYLHSKSEKYSGTIFRNEFIKQILSAFKGHF